MTLLIQRSLSLTPVATVSLVQSAYEADEGDGNVTVCAELVDGILERSVTVYLSTANLTAFGKLQAIIGPAIRII